MKRREFKQKDIVSESYFQTVFRRFSRHKLAVISLVILAVLGGAALLAPFIAPFDPDEIVGSFGSAPSREFWMGTDQIGRDVFSRILYAMRVSLLVGILATLISTVVGVVLGLMAGYFGGVLDMVIMRFTDMVMSFPYILLVLVAASIFKPGMWSIILILGFVDWPGIARLVRGNVLSLRETNFVKGNLIAGMPLRHILDGRTAADGKPWEYAKRGAVAYGTHQAALALASAGAFDRHIGDGYQLYRGCIAGCAGS